MTSTKFYSLVIFTTMLVATSLISGELGSNFLANLWVDSSSHTGYVFYVSWSPDGSKLATASYDKTIKIWDAFLGTVLFTLNSHTEAVRAVEWSPDGTKLASSGDDGIIKLWNTSSWAVIKNLTGHTGGVLSVSWSPNSTLVVSSSGEDPHSITPGDNTIRIWEISTGINIKTFLGHTNSVYRVHWSSDGSKIVSCSHDSTLRIWDIRTGNCTKILRGHTNHLRDVEFAPNGTWVASGGVDSTVRIWNASSGECIKIIDVQNHIRSVSWHPEGDKLAVSGRNTILKIINVTTGEIIANLTGGGVFASVYSPDGSRIAACSAGAICSGGYNSVRVLGKLSQPEALQLNWKAGLLIVSSIAFIGCVLILRVKHHFYR